VCAQRLQPCATGPAAVCAQGCAQGCVQGCGPCASQARVARLRLPELRVGAVNCPTHEASCAEHKVASFPTLLLFPGSHRRHLLHSTSYGCIPLPAAAQHLVLLDSTL